MVLAGNPPEVNANVEELERPLRSGRVVHVKYEFEYDAWKDWAVRNRIHPYATSFLDAKPTYCYKPDENAMYGEPLPRTWHAASDVLHTYPEKYWDELIAGTVGEGMATEFLAWCATAGTLMPLVDKVLRGEDVCAEELSAQFFISGVLVDRFHGKRKLADRICTYSLFSAEHNPEASAVMIKDCCRIDKDAMRGSPHWKKVVKRLADYVV
jgi:hypothetical protein